MEEKVKEFKTGQGGVRSTQSISIKQLVFDYNFDIICINKKKDEVKSILSLQSKIFSNLPDDKLLYLNEYSAKYKMHGKIINNK